MSLPYDPRANLFPLMVGGALAALVTNLREAGSLAEPIVLIGRPDRAILDGRNRYIAGVEAGLFAADVEPTDPRFFIDYEDLAPERRLGSALDFVIAKNLPRRHLLPCQAAMIGARLATLKVGRPKNGDGETPSYEGITAAKAAEMLGVGRATIERARTVLERGERRLIAAVDAGLIEISVAAQAAELAPNLQDEVAAEAEAGHAKVVSLVVKRHARADKEAALAVKQKALPDKRYGVILADPEWRFEPRSRETGMDRAPENHYPTSPTEAIAARPVADIAAEDCALFLWATAPMLEAALTVLKAWGFTYRTHRVWNKVRIGNMRGPGYWFTGEHELVLLGTKGNIPAPALGQQRPSNFDAPIGEHSEKPEEIHETIEAYFPNLPKIELNARRARPGWDLWGFEAPVEDLGDDRVEGTTDGDHVVADLADGTVRAAPADDFPDIPDSLRRTR